MGKLIYLDSAATTKPKFFRSTHKDFWMNSNTPYTRTKEQLELEKAKEKIKSCLGVRGGYVLFFRCATEAIEWLVDKMTKKYKYIETWCSPFEHESVFNVSKWSLCESTKDFFDVIAYKILYCHQLVNQITGDIWDIQNIAKSLKPNQFFGVDLTAAIGHTILPNDFEDYCDALWFSGHKFYAEKNIGTMWISDRLGEYLGASKDPKNQHNLVHGTVDVAGVRMISDALVWCVWCVKDKQLLSPKHWYELYSFLNNKFAEQNIDSALVYSNIFDKSYAINAIYLRGINADALQTYLASKDIYIGVAHSACAGTEDYRVLEAMGFNKKIASQTIRVSFNVDSNYDDIKRLVNEINNFRRLF